MNINPKVSIIIPVYNGSNFLREAIDSAINQTYKNLEVIIVNDGSNDNGKTKEIALSYGNKIRYIEKENGGVSSALNIGIKNMTGEYFSWLSHDDVYDLKKIEKQIDLLRKFDFKSIALCAHQEINEKSKTISKVKKRKLDVGINDWKKCLEEIVIHGSYNGCALLIPKKMILKIGRFDENLKFIQDLIMWIRILFNKNCMVYDNNSYVYSRVHCNQLTQKGQELVTIEARYVKNELISYFTSEELINSKVMYYYLISIAKRNIKDILYEGLEIAKKKKMLNKLQIIIIKCVSICGIFRPKIRKIYYKLFRKISTQ